MINFLFPYNDYYNWDFIFIWSLIFLLCAVGVLAAALAVHVRMTRRMKQEVERLNMENSRLRDNLKQSEEENRNIHTQNSELMKYALNSRMNVDYADVMKVFTDAAVGKHDVTEADWEALYSSIDNAYPEFRGDILGCIKRISKPMLQTVYLLKMGMTNPQICNIMNTPPQTVWYRVKKLKEAAGAYIKIEV